MRREGDRAYFRLDLAPGPRFFLLRLVPDLEFDGRNAGGGVAQGTELDQVAFDLYRVN